MSVSAIQQANGKGRSTRLRAGEVLSIPSGSAGSSAASSGGQTSGTYRVRSGDTLGVIAQRHGTTIRQLKRVNTLRSNRISVGQELKIP